MFLRQRVDGMVSDAVLNIFVCLCVHACVLSFFSLHFCTDGLTRSPPLYVSLNVGAYMTG